jgi:hypothetical protein
MTKMPKLRDVVRGVLMSGGMTQAQLAELLYGTAKRRGKISEMMGATDGGGWEKHWQVFGRLIPIAIALKVIGEKP